MQTFGGGRKDLDTRRGHTDTVFKLCRKRPVFCNSSPPVTLQFDLPFAGIDHWLDREDHAFLEGKAVARLRKWRKLYGLRVTDYARAVAFPAPHGAAGRIRL